MHDPENAPAAAIANVTLKNSTCTCVIICIHCSNPNVLHSYLVLNFVWQRKKCKPVTSTFAMATDATRKAILYLCICLPNGLCVSVTRSVKTPLSDILDLPL